MTEKTILFIPLIAVILLPLYGIGDATVSNDNNRFVSEAEVLGYPENQYVIGTQVVNIINSINNTDDPTRIMYENY